MGTTEKPTRECPPLEAIEALVAAGEETDPGLASHVATCPHCGEQARLVRENNTLLNRVLASRAHAESEHTPGAIPSSPRGYEIRHEIHRGSQGVVYAAEQIATKRTVALKVLLAGAFATSLQRRRFEREIDLVAGLHHPGIVTVHDSGRTDEGRLWLAMELVEGEPLDAYARDAPGGALTTPDLVELFRAICDAVGHAHRRGVLHRDLKPANILVEGTGHPRVLDFGLARPVDPDLDDEHARVTAEPGFIGTLAYVSPEQARGDDAALDVRSDVYSLGVILYELLTGRLPYDVTGRLSSVLDAIATAPPVPPRRVESGRFSVDADLETIVMKSLSKEPDRRYPSVEALERDLDHYLAGEPLDARRDSRWYVLGKLISRHRVSVAIAAAFAIFLTTSAIGLFNLYRRADHEREKLAKINLFLEDTLGSVAPAPGNSEVRLRDMLDEARLWIDIALTDEPEVEAAVRWIIANGYRNLGDLDVAETEAMRALDIRRRLHGEDDVRVAASLNGLALVRRDQGRLEDARDLFAEAVVLRERHLGPDHVETAMARANIAQLMRALGELEAAESVQREVLDVRRRRLGDAHPDVAMTRFNLGIMLRDQGRQDDAEVELARALRTRREILAASHPDLARSMLTLGKLYADTERPAEAEPLLRECVELRRAHLVPGDWRTAEAESELGACLVALGRIAEAEPMLARSAEVLTRERGADDPLARLARERLEGVLGERPTTVDR